MTRGDGQMVENGHPTRKDKIVLIAASLFLVVLAFIAMFVLRNDNAKEREIFKIPVSESELIVYSKENYNSVKVYKQNGRVVINAESESELFDGSQFQFTTDSDITASDVEIIWMTIGGSTKITDDDAGVIAQIKIFDNGEPVFDTTVNFIKNATDAVGEVLKESSK